MDDAARDEKPGGRGHLSLSRKMFDGHDAFWDGDEPFDRRSAWIDLLQMAAFSPRCRVVGTSVVPLERGELLASERFLAERWRWTKGKVERFLGLLEKLGRIVRKSSHGASRTPGVITVVNYATYNTPRATDRATRQGTNEPSAGQSRAKIEEGEEGKEREGKQQKETHADAGGGGATVIRLPTSDAAVREAQADEIMRAANAGMKENPAISETFSPMYPGHASRQVVLDWLGDGIPAELCRRTVYRLAKGFRPDGRNKQVRSMSYFDGEVRNAQDRALATTAEVPDDEQRSERGRFAATGTDGAGPRGRGAGAGKVAGTIRPPGDGGGGRPRIPIE